MHVSGIPYRTQTSSVILRSWVRDEANESLMVRFRDGDPRAFELLPVSYTHLDVYKRQLQVQRETGGGRLAAETAATGVNVGVGTKQRGTR